LADLAVSGRRRCQETISLSRAATLRTAARGLMRWAWRSILLRAPGIARLLPAIIARYACAATAGAPIVPILKRREEAVPDTALNSVAVAPGQLTVAVTPVPRSSNASASVNEFTNALLA